MRNNKSLDNADEMKQKHNKFTGNKVEEKEKEEC